MDIVWNTAEFRPMQRIEAMEEILTTCGAPYPLALSRGLHEDVSARYRLKRFDGHGLLDFQCDPVDCFQVHRSSLEIQRSASDYLCVVQVLGAPQKYQIGKHDLTVKHGDFFLYGNEQKASCAGLGPFRHMNLFFPTETLCDVIPGAHDFLGKLVNGQRGPGALFAAHMRTLTREMAHMDSEELAAAMQVTSLQLAHALGASATVSPAAGQTVTLQKARQYILAHLRRHDLAPARVAEALGISVRYLHLVFESGDTTVGAWTRRQRLERCRHDILTVGRTGRSITEIAFSWGFNDSGHFSKAFRREYGMSPTEYRERAQIAAADPMKIEPR